MGVVDVARGWIGTKFHHQGRVKGVGVDCIGLVVGVAKELGFEVVDQVNYAREPKDGELQLALEQYLMPGELVPGAVVLFKLEKEPQHVGIVSELEDGGLGLIHAYMQSRKVVEHGLDKSWREKIVATYSFPAE